MDAVAALAAQLNTSKAFAGVTMLLLNVGSRHVVADVSAAQERLLSHALAKRVVLFCMLFVATRDVVMAAALTTALVLLADTVLNERSRYCLLPRRLLVPAGPPSLAEYQRARHLVRVFEEAPGGPAPRGQDAQPQPQQRRPATGAEAYRRAALAMARLTQPQQAAAAKSFVGVQQTEKQAHGPSQR